MRDLLVECKTQQVAHPGSGKANIIGQLLVKMDERNPQQVMAREFENGSGWELLLSRLKQRVAPQGALVSTKNQPEGEPLEDGPVSWKSWWDSIYLAEVASRQPTSVCDTDTEDTACAFSSAVKKCVMSGVHAMLAALPPKGAEHHGANTTNIMVVLSQDKNGVKKIDSLLQKDSKSTRPYTIVM